MGTAFAVAGACCLATHYQSLSVTSISTYILLEPEAAVMRRVHPLAAFANTTNNVFPVVPPGDLISNKVLIIWFSKVNSPRNCQLVVYYH